MPFPPSRAALPLRRFTLLWLLPLALVAITLGSGPALACDSGGETPPKGKAKGK